MSDPKYLARGADGKCTFDGVAYLDDIIGALDG